MSMKIDATAYKKTKIIATVGPATQEKINDLLGAGVNGIRLNFSHGTYATHKKSLELVRAAAKKLDRSVAIIQDLHGPKVTVGKLPAGGMEIQTGQILKFQYNEGEGVSGILPVLHDFSSYVKVGHPLYLRDGQIKTVITKVEKGIVTAKAENGGKILSNHGINLPETNFGGEILTDKDVRDLKFAYTNDVDYVAVSFIHTAKDILNFKAILKKHDCKAKVMAKIETKLAIEHLEEIVKVSDAVMVARGDLGVEIGPEEVPVVGRQMILLSRRYKKPVIMATQMMESMMSSPTPSRADASDVSTAVSLGVDAVMLSGETAIGQFPIETVQMMKRIILSSERYLASTSMAVELVDIDENETDLEVPDNSLLNKIGQKTRLVFSKEPLERGKISSGMAQTSISMAAATLAEQLKAKVILAETLTGSTALSISSLRPSAPIIIASPDKTVCNQMAIVWGGKPFLVSRKKNTSVGVVQKLKKRGSVQDGDWIVTAYGKNRGVAGGTDTVRLLEVGA